MKIRKAEIDDAQVLADLAARTFKDTFAVDNEAGDMDDYVRSSFSIESVEQQLRGAQSLFLLAFVEGAVEPVGYAKLRDEIPDPSVSGLKPIEIERLYVDRPGLGKGIGAGLMRECLDRASQDEHGVIWLGVWERNERAIQFYRRWGFETVGSHVFKLGSDLQTDLIMQRST